MRDLLDEIARLKAIAREYDTLTRELSDAHAHLRKLSLRYAHKSDDDTFGDGKARAYAVAAGEVDFALERSRRRLARG